MNKIGVSLKIDVTKIDKARLFQGKNGAKYLDLTIFIDPANPSQYGDHGFITQTCSKEEKEGGLQMPILGNGKIFYGLNQAPAPQQQAPQQQQTAPGSFDDFDDDIPF